MQAKPFLKWVGGKGQLVRKFRNFYPDELIRGDITHYYEPFLGGGAVFFDIAQKYNVKSARLYDINEELILAYRVVQRDVDKLMEFLYRYKKQYISLNKEKRKEYYYEIRQNYNLQRFNINYQEYSENWISRAAQIIFLNKTCYNGLFRMNSKGEFNSPAGDYDNPKILDSDNLQSVSKLLQIAEICSVDFRKLNTIDVHDAFVYFDPPYRPISKTANFTSYSKHEFRDEEQKELAGVFHQLNEHGIKLMLSNSDPKNININDNFFDSIYSDYNIYRIPARRMVNSVASKRGAINEIVVTNYQVSNKG